MQVMLHHTNFMSLSWNSSRHFHKGKEELALVLWHIQGVQATQVLHISLQGQQNLSVNRSMFVSNSGPKLDFLTAWLS